MKKLPTSKNKKSKSSNEQTKTLPEPLAALIDILAKQSAREHHEKVYGVRVDPYSFKNMG